MALAVPHARVVHEALSVGGTTVPHSDSERAAELIRERFPLPVADFFAVTLTGPIAVDSAPYLALLDSLSRRALAEPYVSHVLSYLDARDSTLVSPDHKTTFLVVALRADQNIRSTDVVPTFRKAIHETLNRISWAAQYRANVTGGPALDFDTRQVSKEDTEIGERRSLPFTAVILVLAFGALVAAALPLGIGVTAIVCALALVEIVAGAWYCQRLAQPLNPEGVKRIVARRKNRWSGTPDLASLVEILALSTASSFILIFRGNLEVLPTRTR